MNAVNNNIIIIIIYIYIFLFFLFIFLLRRWNEIINIYIDIYSFSRCFYSKWLTNEEYNKRFIINWLVCWKDANYVSGVTFLFIFYLF